MATKEVRHQQIFLPLLRLVCYDAGPAGEAPIGDQQHCAKNRHLLRHPARQTGAQGPEGRQGRVGKNFKNRVFSIKKNQPSGFFLGFFFIFLGGVFFIYLPRRESF